MKKLVLSFAKDDLELDIESALDYDLTATPTKYPIETGEKVSDHITREPVAFSVDGIVSDATPPTATLTPPGPDRARAVFARLQRAMSSGELFDIVADLQTFESMALTKLKATQGSGGDVGATSFKLSFEHVRIASAKTATVKALKAGLRHGGKRAKVKAPPVTSTPARRVIVDGKVRASIDAYGDEVPMSLSVEQTLIP